MPSDLLRNVFKGLLILVQGRLAVVDLRLLLRDRGLVTLLCVLHLFQLGLQNLLFLGVLLRHLLEVLLPVCQLLRGGGILVILRLGELQLGVGLLRCRGDALHRGLEILRALRC